MESHSVCFQQIGDRGPTILLLHGWGQSKQALLPLAKLLAQKNRVLLCDLPGFGEAKAPGLVWSSFGYAQYLVEHLKSSNIDSLHILGHSFGGKIAASIALNYPDRVDRLFLLAPAGLKPRRSWTQQLRMNGIRLAGRASKWLDRLQGSENYSLRHRERFGSRDYKAAQGIMRQILVKTVNEDLTNQIPHIKHPTSILWGELDGETPFEMANRWVSLLPNAQLLMLPYKEHDLFLDSGAHLCAYLIQETLNSKEV